MPYGCRGPKLPPAELAVRRAELLGRIATCAAPILEWDTAKAEAWLPGLKAALKDLRYEEEQHSPTEPLIQEAIKATTTTTCCLNCKKVLEDCGCDGPQGTYEGQPAP